MMYISEESYISLVKERDNLKRALSDISKIDYLNLHSSDYLMKLQDAVVMAESMLDDLYNK